MDKEGALKAMREASGRPGNGPTDMTETASRSLISAVEDWRQRDAVEIEHFLTMLREFCQHRRANLERFERLMGVKQA